LDHSWRFIFGFLLGLWLPFAPWTLAQESPSAILEYLQWDPSSEKLKIILTLQNPLAEPVSLYGTVEISTTQQQKRIGFVSPVSFTQSSQVLEVEAPPFSFQDEDQLILAVRLYDRKNRVLLYQTGKFSAQRPQVGPTHRFSGEAKEATVLLEATQERFAQLASRNTKQASAAAWVELREQNQVRWLTQGDSLPWASRLVEAFSIRDGSKNVALTPEMVIETTEPLVASSLKDQIHFRPADGPQATQEIPVSYKLLGKRLTLGLPGPLAYGTSYRLVLGNGIKSIGGQKMAQEEGWSFTTLPSPPKMTIQSSQPDLGATQASISGGVVVVFSAPLDPKSLDLKNIRLTQGETPVKGKAAIIGKRMIFKTDSPLKFETAYHFHLEGLRDLEGNNQEGSFELTFTTEKEAFRELVLELKGMYPQPKARGLGKDTEIWVQLDAPIDPATLAKGALLLQGNQPTPGHWEAKESRIYFVPESGLLNNQVYVVQLTPALKSLAGGGLRKEVAWPFATRADMGYPAEEDPNVLIFSPSHEVETYTREREGILKIGVTTFEPIRQIDVNGQLINQTGDTKAEFEIPYKLTQKITKFEVSVVTPSGLGRKDFTLHLGSREEGPSFRLISILSGQSLDNVDSSADGRPKTAATKSSITLVPQFTWRFSKDNAVLVKGILLREKYAKKAYQSKETAFTQFTLEWELKDTWVGTLTSDLGWNDIRTDNSVISTGKNKLIAETYFSMEMEQVPEKGTSFKTKLEGKNSNFIAKAASIDDETDATVTTLTLTGKSVFFDVTTQLDLQSENTNAVGINKDNSALKEGIKFSGKLGDFTPSLYLYQKTTSYPRVSTSTGIKQKDVSTNTEIKVGYALVKGLQLGIEYKYKDNKTNASSGTYKLGTAGLSLTHIW